MDITFDMECDALLEGVTQVHCGSLARGTDDPSLYVNIPLYLEHLDQADTLIGHNIIAYDLMVLWKLYRWKPRPTVKIVDTMVLSMLVHADIHGGHGLEEWGLRLGEHKTDYLAAYKAWKLTEDPEWKYQPGEEWLAYNDIMGEYCRQDVRVCRRVHQQIRQDMVPTADEVRNRVNWAPAEWMEHEFAKLFARQAWRGVMIDKPHCERMVAGISEEMAALETEIEPQLPERDGNKGQLDSARPPKLCLKKDGTPTASTTKWFDKVEQNGGEHWQGLKYGTWHMLPTPMENDDERAPLRTKFPMKMSDQPLIKAWLMDLGWIPTMWNYKKAPDKHGKLRTVRDDNGEPVVTHPKFHDKGELCKNLEGMIEDGNLPSIAKQCVRWIIIRHRRGFFQGLLDNVRPDGTVPATGFSCGTPTTRVTHSIVANIPKNDPTVVMGKECRAAFIARPGRVLGGTDASGLELRCLAARARRQELVDTVVNGTKEAGTDIHTINGRLMGCSRATAKTAVYGWLYGAGDAKLGATLGGDPARGEIARAALVAGLPGIEKLLEAVEKACRRGYIRGLDGRRIKIRSRHAGLNTILQSDGSILVKWATVYQNRQARFEKLDAFQVVHYHDEVVDDCHPDHAQRMGRLFVEGLQWAGKRFEYACPLDGEVQVGQSWADIH